MVSGAAPEAADAVMPHGTAAELPRAPGANARTASTATPQRRIRRETVAALREERREPAGVREALELGVGRARGESRRCSEHLRQQLDAADRVEEDLRVAEDPVHREVDVALLGQRLVPRAGRLIATVPPAHSDRLDRLQGDAPFRARRRKRVEVLGVHRVLHLDVAVRAEHGVERESLEALGVHPRDRSTMTGDAYEPNESLVARLERGLER